VATIAVLFALSAAAQSRSKYVIIVHPDNPTTFLSGQEVSFLFLKNTTQWNHGTDVEPVDLSAPSGVRDAFSEDIHGRPVAAIQSYWQQQIFSGRGVPPLEVKSDAEVVAYVRDHPGAVGYVSSSVSLSGVKTVSVRVPPQRIKYVEPHYPPLARRARVQGNVVLQVIVDRDGDVADVRVIQGLPHGLSEEASRAAWKWKFRPAMQDGEPVEGSVTVAVRFSL
jgi:TonB family protein